MPASGTRQLRWIKAATPGQTRSIVETDRRLALSAVGLPNPRHCNMFGLPNIGGLFARPLFASSLISHTFSGWPRSCNEVSVRLDQSKSGERDK